MIPTVQLISMTAIDWKNLLPQLNSILGRSPSRGIDTSGKELHKPEAFLQLLDAIRSESSDPKRAIQRRSLWGFLSYGFLVQTDILGIHEVMTEFQGSKVLADERLLILNGTLDQWRSFVIGNRPAEITSQIFDIFQNLGLREVWSNYEKKDQGNGTFLLTYRR